MDDLLPPFLLIRRLLVAAVAEFEPPFRTNAKLPSYRWVSRFAQAELLLPVSGFQEQRVVRSNTCCHSDSRPKRRAHVSTYSRSSSSPMT